MAKAGERLNGRNLDGIELTVDIAGPIEAWRDRYASTIVMRKYRRAAAWAPDETAKKALMPTNCFIQRWNADSDMLIFQPTLFIGTWFSSVAG
jgi:hypothetical protein